MNNPASVADTWWSNGIIYQIYPLTFADGNGDGVGDLQGIIDRLDYLNDGNPDSDTSLHVDALWLSPINASPMVDNGYDVSDYYTICPTFGTCEDFDRLLQAAHDRGVRIIMDLVVNHTSDEHSWFKESATGRDNPKADWYLWQEPAEGGEVPNNWQSYFGGTGWTYCKSRGQFYFHTFNENQPDLNWQNPEVRQAIYDVIRYWLDRGVDGFRLDASSAYSKDPDFRDNPLKYGASDPNRYDNYHHLYNKNLPENHRIIQQMRSILDEYQGDGQSPADGHRLLIGETFIDNRLFDSVTFHGVNDDELHLPLNFEFPLSPWYPGHLQRDIEKQERLTPGWGWPCYFLDNHDLPRHLSRWIKCSLCVDPLAIGKAAAALLLTVRGTPILYYGQELGMVDHEEIPPERIRDRAVVVNEGDAPPPRDGARTPMQWDNSPQAGFSFGKDVEPWLPVNPNYSSLNVEKALADPNSILNFYQQLIRIRQQSSALRRGSWRSLVNYPHEHLVYLRETSAETVLVAINFSYEKPFEVDYPLNRDDWRVLLSTDYESGKVIDLADTLKPFEVSILQKDQPYSMP
ncbi:glucohydrolase [filamentous cyanobacterium CCP5]|nr:glucohydrolase [filamentous cyanobacterium CCP5]